MGQIELASSVAKRVQIFEVYLDATGTNIVDPYLT